MHRSRTQGSGFPTLPDQSKVKHSACEPEIISTSTSGGKIISGDLPYPEIVSSSVSKPGKYRGPLLFGKNRPFHLDSLDRDNSGKGEGEKSGVQKKK